MNRINKLFKNKPEGIMNIYYTAGFPELNSTVPILKALQNSGVDMVEIGMPYSDPVADGETIQQANQLALNNGMTLELLFSQLAEIRNSVNIPIILMGYINPILQFGVENFCQKCQEVGIDGLILPDLPIIEFEQKYKSTFLKYGLLNIFLITPQTSESRIRQIDTISKGFIYIVSSSSITGKATGFSDKTEQYFQYIKSLSLNNPSLIGFGVFNNQTFTRASHFANGAIIGSQFIRILQNVDNLENDIELFINSVREPAIEYV